ncbi:ATP-binding cassette domain-containing protein [Amycolatopsis sp. A133]|uniref:ATP-binding cassette domain-containing protein n=1 Tax=Amycolatopsis sp. A133 TaxID=3064472 RepID=UPI0027EFE0BD|nr:ATP-binding cassette domain-containing protein [Amycolatopsis sp. A133]MDQ7805085.1 ATP-binding cassette domain-containing protein [Amycolatopsis sp. A133]
MSQPVIAVTDLAKQYGEVTALAGISLTAARGAVLAVLGHNGAGKTTLIDILSTRVRPSAGTARVCGYDVVQRGRAVRRRIGVTGQFAAVDDALSGRGNLVLIARLLGAKPRQALARATELIAAFGLEDAADRPAGTYSGGMRRRLDLAAGLVGAPQVLFLDEPTTGLDPVSRSGLWTIVEGLAARGTTVVLTTQYLEEADRLADHVVVLGFGHITVSGTPAQLKARLGTRTATCTFGTELALRRAVDALSRLGITAGRAGLVLTVPLSGPGDIPVVVRALDAAGAPLRDLTVTEPTLDDVYLSLHRTAAS